MGSPGQGTSAQWAPRRVSVRWDNDPYLFPDPFQGWPAGANGYTDLIDGLLRSDLVELQTGVDVTLANLDEHVQRTRSDLVILTCPLDVFAGERFGRLDWRGIIVRSVHIPHVEYAQGAMVVNYPGAEYPFIRIHETKHASGQQCEGTVLGFEFTNAPTRYYPIELPQNRELNDRYKALLRDEIGHSRTYFAGRLANYLYTRTLRQRLANPSIGDDLRRLCRAGSSKVPSHVLPSIVTARERGTDARLLTMAVAGWFRCLHGGRDPGRMALDDPLGTRLRSVARRAGTDPRPLMSELAGFRALAQDAAFAVSLEEALTAIDRLGVRGALASRLTDEALAA